MQVYKPNVNQALRIVLSIGAIGAYQQDNNYRYSDSDCTGGGCPEKIQWGTSDYSTNNDGIIRESYTIKISAENDIQVDKQDIGYNLSHVCNHGNGTWVIDKFSSDLNSNYNRILGYTGHEAWIFIKPYNMVGWYQFYVKPGLPSQNDSSKIDLNNMGNLIYCGKVSQPTRNGIELFTLNSISGNYADVTYNIDLINNSIMAEEHHFMNSSNVGDCGDVIDTDETSLYEVYLEPESPEPEPEPEECVCDSCVADIESCCNDNVFTSDLNEFSSIKCPDTYINPDTGEEERLSWNGLMWVCRTLQIGFKVFYALVWYLFCKIMCKVDKAQSTQECLCEQLKRIADILEEKEMSVDVSVTDKSNVEYNTFNGRVQDKMNDGEGWWNG